MKIHILFILLAIAVLSFSSCQSDSLSQSSKISGKDLLSKSARSSSLDLKSVSTIKLFDASAIELDLSDLEQINLELKSLNLREQQARINAIQDYIKQDKKEESTLKVELMLSDEPLNEGLVLIAIESVQDQILDLELYDKRGNLFVAEEKLQLKEGTNYKRLYSEEIEAQQYLLLLKDENGKGLMRKLYFEL